MSPTDAPATGVPTRTPLRRISRGSLSALSASRSRAGHGHAYEGLASIQHLAPVFAELNEACDDVKANMAKLDEINTHLDDFNEGFASLLYGLRQNVYTTAFPGAPEALNFRHAQVRAERKAQQEQEARLQAEQEAREAEERQRQLEAEEATSESGQHGGASDATFFSMRGDADYAPGRKTGLTSKSKGIPVARGGKTAAQRKKESNIKFAAPIISTLPLEYREKQPQRADMETTIGALRENHEGLRVQELVKMFPLVPQHRINDSLLTLVRAKHAIKLTSGGLVYRLDPLKYPPGS